MEHYLNKIDDIDDGQNQRNARFQSMSSGSSMNTDINRRTKSDGPFPTFGEQLVAIRNAGTPGGVRDNRLDEVRAATGLNESTPSDGGFLVQTDFSNEIMRNVWDFPVPRLIRKFQVSGNSNGLKINGFDETSRADGSRSGGVQSYWTGEAAAYTGSKPKYRQIGLELNKLTGLCYVTDEVMEDATALEDTVNIAFVDEFGFKISDAIVNGTGAGMPLGVVNAGCLITVGKEAGQTADTIVYENIVNMWSRLMPQSHRNAVWLVSPSCLPQLFSLYLGVGTGGVAVYQPASGAAGRPYQTLMGRPVVVCEQCQTLGDLGDIILADFSNYVAIDKGAMRTDYSVHVQFLYGEGVFRATYRFDGQPVLASAITPANGTDTLSHFVALEARD